jgi:hypothetical protein
MNEPARIVFNAEPLTFDRAGALTYTGLAPKRFDELERAGLLTGKPHGRNGTLLYRRRQLEDVIAALFSGNAANDIDDEFSGIGSE